MGLLELIIVTLLLLWLIGAFVVPVAAVGSLIHLLLVIAVIVLIIRLIQGSRAL